MALAAGVWMAAAATPESSTGGVLHVTPSDSLAVVSQRLAADASISEVVLSAGTYRESLVIPPLAGADSAPGAGAPTLKRPLLIRPAVGARVVFDGSMAVGRPRAVKGRPGVFFVDDPRPTPTEPATAAANREPPRLWQPDARVRYQMAADLDAVERFPATYYIGDGRIYFHTGDGRPPGVKSILMSARDFGLLIRRPHVTVRDLEFRNYLARGKWSAGVQIYAAHGTVERCSVANASFGFTLNGDHGALLESTARDVGGGVYASGKEDRVEGCRFFKDRDDYNIPTYPQDDTGIQFYYPAEAGTARGNLSVGFQTGILIKASPSAWVVERNTLVGHGMKSGFLGAVWPAAGIFRQNVIAGYETPIDLHQVTGRAGIERNCHDSPEFIDEAASDYRLDPAGSCLVAAAGGPVGVPTAAASGLRPDRRPREWHVSPTGRDGAGGTVREPVRTIQYAVDRAGPGDTVLLHPGIYSEPVRVVRGGAPGRPITIRAIEKWTAILDGGRRSEFLIAIDQAPFVAIRDLEIRWYRAAGIRVLNSPGVHVSGCRIWNSRWSDGTWPEGDGVRVESSRQFTGERNVLYRQEQGFHLISSPRATLTNNTAVANLYAGAVFIRSIEGSVCTHNSFAYQGNDALVIVETAIEKAAGKARLASFQCDYNNYGLTLKDDTFQADQKSGAGPVRIVPRPADRQLLIESEGIVYYQEEPGEARRFVTMQKWRDFSGKDKHSIFADPLYVSTATGDFRLEPGSPNIGAGADGATIGAYEKP